MRQNKLERLALTTISQLMNETGAYPNETPSGAPLYGTQLALLTILDNSRKAFLDKHSSLFALLVNDEEKGFIALTPGNTVIKLFFFVADEEAK